MLNCVVDECGEKALVISHGYSLCALHRYSNLGKPDEPNERQKKWEQEHQDMLNRFDDEAGQLLRQLAGEKYQDTIF